MRCDEITPELAGVVDESIRLDRAQRRHVEQCLRCQAELARYRKLLRTLHDLRTDVSTPPPGLLAELLAGLDTDERAASRLTLTARRAAYLGGIAAAATAAGAGAAIVLVSRGRRGRLPLAG